MEARLRALRRLHKNVGISVPLETQERALSLLIVYVALVIAGDFVAYFVGLVIERNVLWGAWVIAVRLTQPRVRP